MGICQKFCGDGVGMGKFRHGIGRDWDIFLVTGTGWGWERQEWGQLEWGHIFVPLQLSTANFSVTRLVSIKDYDVLFILCMLQI